MEMRGITVGRDVVEDRAGLPGNRGHVRFAKPSRRFHQRIEHRLEIEGRAADDLEDVGGRGLLLQRLPQFGQQPRILDRDSRLIGEGAS